MTQTSVASPAACPLCGSQALTPVLERTGVPVFQNALLATAAAARAAPRGDLALLRCGDCGFIHNHAFNPQLIAYGADYENDQSLSRTFARHLDAMADRVIGALPVGATVLEVGCGQGGFVRRLAQRGPGRLRAALG
ncbi:MAG: class I SAM-dependent methyltransferase, partial [Alphaproteobacteria bacterium]|nr:class I SAM-dependent methyltransferase [Alphaproteobacteria bacterium]